MGLLKKGGTGGEGRGAEGRGREGRNRKVPLLAFMIPETIEPDFFDCRS